jgi:polyisoprenyl-phosphate glycosyltransferase
MAHLSVVVPVYQAEYFLNELYQRLKLSLNKITKNYEIVLVEDCGGDESWDIIRKLAKKDKRVKAIQLSRNFGQHYAITAGLDRCNGDWIVVMDCDLQDQPKEIHKLYSKAKEGFDVVLAVRINRQDPKWKLATAWIFYKTFNFLTDLSYDGKVGNFCIISRKVLGNFKLFRENLRFIGGIVNWMGFPTSKVEVEHAISKRGKSSYTIAKLLKLALDAVIAYSDKPLWLSVRLGFTLAFISFFIGSYILYRSFVYGSPIVGWGSLFVSIYFLGGIIIGILGIVGIYVGKTFGESKKRPLYIIRNTINI